MAVPYYGDIAEDATIYMPFNAFTSDDPAASATITNFINTDVHIHKGSGASSSTLSTTQRNSANGITVDVDFDTITGNHVVTIDTSENTSPAGFYVTGQEYLVRIEGTTVDLATVNAWIGSFSIERAGGVLEFLKAQIGTAGANLNEAGGTGDQFTGIAAVGDVTNLSNIPDIPANWITAAGINADAITEAKIADNAIAAEHIAAAAIDNATFAADVGSTAYATNIIALAVQKALVEYKLDHLVHTADADDVADNSIIAKLAHDGATADWSLYVNTTDSLMAIRDWVGDGTNLAEAGGDGDHLTAIAAVGDVTNLSNLPTIPANWITAAGINADAITAAKVAADVHTEGANAVWDDAMVETTGAPAITGTFRAALEWMFALSRNKILQTATLTTLRNDADGADLATSVVADDATTYTRNEWST